MRTTQIQKDSTETLVTYPPFEAQYLYQASAADVRIRTPSTAMPDEGSEEAATVDAVSTTLASAATRGDTSLALTSGTSVADNRYYLVEDNGDRYPVLVATVSTNTAYLAEPLLNDISSGAAFKGIAITHALTADETSGAGRTGLMKVRATLDGVQREFDQWFEVVRQIFPITLTPSRLARRGEAKRLRDRADVGFMDTILAAWEDILRPKLRASGILEETINTPSEIEPAHIEACLLLLKRDANADDETVTIQEERFERALADIKASVKLRIDQTETDSAPSDDRPHLAPWEVSRFTR